MIFRRCDRGRATHVVSGFKPTTDRVLNVRSGFHGRFAVRHAAGKIWNGSDVAAAIFFGQRLDDDFIIVACNLAVLTASMNAMSFLMYTAFTGRLKRTVKISF